MIHLYIMCFSYVSNMYNPVYAFICVDMPSRVYFLICFSVDMLDLNFVF